MIEVSRIPFSGWQNSLRISNDCIALVAPLDIGPRILSYGFLDGENQFHVSPLEAGLTGGNQWRLYGGHRLWIAPENPALTPFPDNRSLTFDQLPNGICLTAPVEETSGFQKSITIEINESDSHIRVTHKLINQSDSSQPASPWAVTVMRPGGVAVLPIGKRGNWPDKLTAHNTLSLWVYTCMADPRWTWGDRYILLRQDAKSINPQKVGMHNKEGWAAYVNNDTLFLKTFDVDSTRHHPDLNSNLETWTNHELLELETLGPLVQVEPFETITHIEHWYLFKDVSIPCNDNDVEKNILPRVRQCQTMEQ
jgi:hypothetical protein